MTPTFTPLREWQRRAALGGIVGVVGFVGAWTWCGLVRPGYDPVDDAISRLAEVGAPDRWVMTAGFVAFGVGIPIYALALRSAVEGPAWIAAMLAGLATLGVAAAPLGRADTAHNLFAGFGYITLAATPLLASLPLRRRGDSVWARWSVICGTASAVLLAATTLGRWNGLAQRLGLGATDLWIVATAWSMWRHPRLGRPSGNGVH